MKESIREDCKNKKYQILHIDNVNEIRKVVYEFDKVFSPSLSERILDLDTYVQKLYRNAIIFIAIEENDFVGFVAFYANDMNTHIAYLTQIAVKPKAQNKAIGKDLIDLCTKTSKDNGMVAIKLEVYNNNMKAIGFYKKHGFYFCDKASAKSMYMMKKLK